MNEESPVNNSKIIMKINVKEFIEKTNLSLHRADDESVKLDREHFPENAIYDESMALDEKNSFCGYMWSDGTLTHHFMEAQERIMDLFCMVTRGGNKNKKYKYSDIFVEALGDRPEDNDKPKWMSRTRTIIYFQEA